MTDLDKDRLSRVEQWAGIYDRQTAAGMQSAPARPPRSAVRRWFRRLLGERGIQLFQDYPDWLFLNVLYRRFLPEGPGLKAIEIGSAPGDHLVELRRLYGLDPHGVEYTASGAAVNRKVFAAAGLDPNHVIEADAFSAEFLDRYAGAFDVVISRGFLEHFKDPRKVVDMHLRLLKPGGTMIVEIPHFRGIYYPWFRWLRPDVMTWHNFEVMKKPVFAAQFDDPRLEERFLGYYGTFSLRMFIPAKQGFVRRLGLILARLQLPVNALLRLLFPRGGPNCGLLSPFLLYVGTRRDSTP